MSNHTGTYNLFFTIFAHSRFINGCDNNTNSIYFFIQQNKMQENVVAEDCVRIRISNAIDFLNILVQYIVDIIYCHFIIKYFHI